MRHLLVAIAFCLSLSITGCNQPMTGSNVPDDDDSSDDSEQGDGNTADDDDTVGDDNTVGDDDTADNGGTAGDDDTAGGDDNPGGDNDNPGGDDDNPGGDDDNPGGDDDTVGDDDDDGSDLPNVCIDDAFEDNDEQAFASTITPGTFANLVSCEDDDDYYAITVAAGATITVDLLFDHDEGDIDLRVENDAGDSLGGSASTDDNESVGPVTVPDAGTYYVKVLLWSDAGGITGNTYQLVVSVGTATGDDDDSIGDDDDSIGDDDDSIGDDDDSIGDDDDSVTPPACVDDAFEDNDTEATAAPIASGSLAGLQACASDSDYFAVNLTTGDEVSIALTFAHAEGDIDIEFLDPNGVTLDSAASASDNEDIGPVVVTETGLYRVHVSLFGDTGSVPGNTYDMNITVSSPTPVGCTEDGYEDNDSWTTAYALPAGDFSDTGLASCPSDEDWFEYWMVAGETVNIAASFSDSDGDINIELFNPSGSYMTGAYSIGDDENLNYTVSTTGTWYFKVFLNDDDSVPGNSYDLDVSYTPAPDSCVDDAYEDNDTSPTATYLGLSTVSISSLVSCPGDADWFEYYLADGDTLYLDVFFSDAAGDIDVELYGPDGLYETGTYTGNDNEFLTFPINETGAWLIRVYLAGDDPTPGNTYSIAATYSSPTCTDDGYEDNDTASTATNLGLTPFNVTDLSACPGDDDYFSYYMYLGESIDIDVMFDDDDGDIDIALYDPSGTYVSGAYSNNNDENLSYTVTSTGLWKFKVYLNGDDSYPGNDYDVSVTWSPAVGCADDAYEDNDSDSSPSVIGDGAFSGLQSCPNDDDWYSIFLIAGDKVDLDLYSSYAEGDIDLRLYNPSGSLVSSSITTADHEYIHSYTAISTGSYLIKASLWSDMGVTPGSGYSLDVDITYGASCIEDTFEEDDYPFLATSVPMWVSDYTVTDMTACPADSDWFETFVTDTEWLSVDVTFVDAQGDIDLKVYDPSGALRLWSFGWADFESAMIDVDSSGWWSVEVYLIGSSDDLYPGNTYDINISRL